MEIVRAFHHAGRVLVLDEPTAALSDVTWLFDQIRRATARGIAILYISHRLAEVRSLCPVATVLRNGRSVATVDLRQADDDEIFELLVGHSKASESVRRSRVTVGAPCWRCAGSPRRSLPTSRSRSAPARSSGCLPSDGQGQRSLFYALAGLEKRLAGEVLVEGRPSRPGKPGDALRDGIGLLPEERKTEGILANLSSASNIVLPILDRIGRRGFVWPASSGPPPWNRRAPWSSDRAT